MILNLFVIDLEYQIHNMFSSENIFLTLHILFLQFTIQILLPFGCEQLTTDCDISLCLNLALNLC